MFISREKRKKSSTAKEQNILAFQIIQSPNERTLLQWPCDWARNLRYACVRVRVCVRAHVCVRVRMCSSARCRSYVAAFSEPQHNKLSRPSPIFTTCSKRLLAPLRESQVQSRKKKKCPRPPGGGRERPKALQDFTGAQECTGGVSGRERSWND